MALPQQFVDQDLSPSGFYTVSSPPYVLTAAASIMFDADAPTAILVGSDASTTYALGATPTGTGVLHYKPAGAFPIIVKAGEKIYIAGTATISVIEENKQEY